MSRYERIALVNPPIDEDAAPCLDTGYWQPLNLLTLASYLREHGYEGDIKILDREILETEDLTQRLLEFGPDLVGLSPNISSYKRSVEIAGLVNENGADVVMGGSYANELASQILEARGSVNFVVKKAGEEALHALVSGTSLPEVPNLVYRDGPDIARSRRTTTLSNATAGELDYGLLDMEAYFAKYKGSPNVRDASRPITILTQRGCAWRERTKGGCVFCSRLDFNHNLRLPWLCMVKN